VPCTGVDNLSVEKILATVSYSGRDIFRTKFLQKRCKIVISLADYEASFYGKRT
jgi:hypothetical protein